MRILAFDIGGTKISSAVVSVGGKLLSPAISMPTPKDAGKIEEYIKKRLSEEEFDGAAVASFSTSSGLSVNLWKPMFSYPAGRLYGLAASFSL